MSPIDLDNPEMVMRGIIDEPLARPSGEDVIVRLKDTHGRAEK